MSFNQNRREDKRANIRRAAGFTMIEILVVVSIIAILVALTVSVVGKVRKAAYATSTSAELSAISQAIQAYYSDYKAYPGPLANNQLGSAYAPTQSAFLANNTAVKNPLLKGENGVNFAPGLSGPLGHITGAQNLVLGLCGGLEVVYDSTGAPTDFFYNPLDIFPDGSHPGPVGASNLSANQNFARRQIAYMTPKQGEISVPSMSFNGGAGASFADFANRSPSDAPIPVLLDKYPDAMPILYIRTNPSGQAIVGIRNSDTINGSPDLVDTSSNVTPQVYETPQYDLCQILDYTLPNSNNPASPRITSLGFAGGFFGVNYNSPTPYHGLQGLGNQALYGPSIDGIGTTVTSTEFFLNNGYAAKGQNAVAYFRDPTFIANSSTTYNPAATNTHAGVPREKDGFLLITAGPDRAYGTSDDLIFPGTLKPAQ